MKALLAVLTAAGIAAASAAAAVPVMVTVSTTDIIPDDQRDAFNGFEGLPAGNLQIDAYTFDGITVTQVNGDTAISTTYPWGYEGARAWYPNSGDFGYTRITLEDGGAFSAIGLLVSNGFSATLPGLYSLRRGGVEVAGGSFVNTGSFGYLGFSGGVFDELWLRDDRPAPAFPEAGFFESYAATARVSSSA